MARLYVPPLLAWLLVPKGLKGRVPGIIAIHQTNGKHGKDEVAGISGHRGGTFPARSIGLMGNLSGTGADGTIALWTEQRGLPAFGRRDRPVD